MPAPPFPRAPLVLVFEASPRLDSRSTYWATHLVELLTARGVTVSRAAQRLLPLVPAGVDEADYPGEVRAVLRVAERADAIVLAAPVHRNAVSGVARNAIELLRDGIESKPVLPLIAAGSQRAHLAAEALRGDLFLNFGCVPLRPVVASDDVDLGEMASRVARAAEALLGRVPGAVTAVTNGVALKVT